MGSTSPHLIGPAYQAGLDRGHRRRAGIFYTPFEVAVGLVRLAFGDHQVSDVARAPRVCDLAAGGGAFLLAAAAELADAGHARGRIVEDLLWGVDIDADAVAVCRRSLADWAAEAGEVVEARHVVVGDGLSGLGAWDGAPAGGFDVVVGNPPFQSQLLQDTARRPGELVELRGRFGAAVSPYVDTAALFLVAASGAVTPGGSVVLVLPESVLSARDSGAARAAVLETCALVGFWWAGSHLFDAVVDVCAPVLRKGATRVARVPRWSGPDVVPAPPVSIPTEAMATGGPWGALLAPPSAPRPTVLGVGPTLGSVARATAGFRDQFYGIADHVVDGRPVDDSPSPAARARLVTAGLIDPLRCRWGATSARFAGKDWSAPWVDLGSLAAADARLARWGSERLVPKVVLATQTRVLEAAVDVDGSWWPSVPTIAVLPNDPGAPQALWDIAAVLAAPAVSAWALDRHRGSALARDAVKLAASQVLEIPLPSGRAEWSRGAAAAERAHAAAHAGDPSAWRAALVELGEAMTDAYDSSQSVLDWWLDRLPPGVDRARRYGLGVNGDDLRAHLAATPSAALMPGVWDPLSARLSARAGFEVVFLSGFAVAGTFLGQPDVGLLTQPEMADAARRVCGAAPDTMVVVDADTGYGSAANVVRTVELWEQAGAAGLFLEDQVWPKRCGHMAGKQVVDGDEWLAKLRAALDHRGHLHVTARTDARAPLGLGEAIDRARRAADLGVDAVFVEAPESIAELEQIASALAGVTLVANMVEAGRTPLLTPAELHDLGFDLIVSPLSGLLSATAALDGAYRRLATEGTLRDHLDDLCSFDGFTEIVGLDEVRALDTRYQP